MKTHESVPLMPKEGGELLNFTSLYYQEGTSDKEYLIWLERHSEEYLVVIAYGRRGAVNNKYVKYRGSKPGAERMFASQRAAKLKKGYEEKDVSI